MPDTFDGYVLFGPDKSGEVAVLVRPGEWLQIH